MRHWLAVFGCAIALSACQTPSPEPMDPGGHAIVVHPGDAAVSVVGTPFYLAFKSVACAAGVAIAAPLAAIAALSESRTAPEIQRDLGDGVSHNCGPPYALSPYRVVSVEPTPGMEHPSRLPSYRSPLNRPALPPQEPPGPAGATLDKPAPLRADTPADQPKIPQELLAAPAAGPTELFPSLPAVVEREPLQQ